MFEDKSPTEMKDPLHDKWYLEKTKARSEVLGVLVNSLKREFALTAKHQSFLLSITCTGSSPEKSHHRSGLPCVGCCANTHMWTRAGCLNGHLGREEGRLQSDGQVIVETACQ